MITADTLTHHKANIYGIVNDSIVDGPGLRLAVFFQGCPHHCPGCHNPESQVFKDNQYMSPDEILAEVTPLTSGLTVSGGEPFIQPEALLELVQSARQQGIENIWVWSGWTYETLMGGKVVPLAPEILNICDVLVDGPFIEELRDTVNLHWRGSSNQRLVDLKNSTPGHVVSIEE